MKAIRYVDERTTDTHTLLRLQLRGGGEMLLISRQPNQSANEDDCAIVCELEGMMHAYADARYTSHAHSQMLGYLTGVFDQGYHAGRDGKDMGENPYKTDPKLHGIWCDGWFAATEDVLDLAVERIAQRVSAANLPDSLPADEQMPT